MNLLGSRGGSNGKEGEAPTITKEQAVAAGNLAADFMKTHGPEYVEKMKVLASKATDGSTSQRSLAVVGGIGMTVIGVLSFLSDTLTLSVVSALLSAYIILFGLITVVLESKHALCSAERKNKIYEYVKALEFVWGRGIFYLFCGIVMFSVGGIFNYIGGLYMLLLGGWMLYNGVKSFNHLGGLKGEIKNEKEAAAKFREFDTDKSGDLDSREFANLAKALGHELSHPLLETTIKLLDTDRSGTISLKEFLDWYNSKDDPMSAMSAEGMNMV
mmetsp:Transcript_2717/g.3868  ORF Transcript_2717/g.3868 Transcript_2717/m.3868 type:complete len:272 (+) Transcript_2717:50-865(+)